MLIDFTLKFHLHIRVVYCKASGIFNNTLRGTVSRSPVFIIQAFITHVPIIYFSSVLWYTGFIGLESTQERKLKKKN